MISKQRNSNLDSLKGIAAILIVFIHVKFGGGTGQYISDLARFGVPVFFLTSGFFAARSDKNKLWHSIAHIFRLIGVAYALNLARIFVESHCSLSQTIQVIINTCTWKHLVSWLLLNTTTLVGVAWFLWALLYCYCIHILLYRRFINDQLPILLAIMGFLAGLSAQLLLPLIVGKSWDTNSVWMCGLPFYTTGLLISRKGDLIRNRLSNMRLGIIAILGFITLTIGSFLNSGLLYMGSAAMANALFCLAVFNPSAEQSLLSKVGSKYAFYVYIMHPLFMHVLDAVFNTSGWFLWIRPLIVLALTLASAFLFYKIVDQIKGKVREQRQYKN